MPRRITWHYRVANHGGVGDGRCKHAMMACSVWTTRVGALIKVRPFVCQLLKCPRYVKCHLILSVEAIRSWPFAFPINRKPLHTSYSSVNCSIAPTWLLLTSSSLLRTYFSYSVSITTSFYILNLLFMSDNFNVRDAENTLTSWISNHLRERSYMDTEVTKYPSFPREESSENEESPSVDTRPPSKRRI